MLSIKSLTGWSILSRSTPRQSGKVLYPLDEVLLLCLLAVLAGAEGWVEIAEFGKAKLEFLRRFRAFEKGTPSHDQLGDPFAASTRKPSSSASSTGSPRYGCLGRCGR